MDCFNHRRKKLVELVESNNQYSITTNNQTGNVKFRFVSKLDNSISKDLIFSIVDKPNTMRVYDEGHNLLSNHSTISVDYHGYKALNVEFAFDRQFKDGTKMMRFYLMTEPILFHQITTMLYATMTN